MENKTTGKLIITRKENVLLLILWDGRKPSLIEAVPALSESSILGNIYLAKVRDLAPGLNSAFLTIDGNRRVYLSLSECRDALVTNRCFKTGETLKPEDEVVIQITGEAQKSKPPIASCKLTLTGSYCVCSSSGHGIHYSKKLSSAEKERIGQALAEAQIKTYKSVQFMIRTNAGKLEDPAPLLQELETFSGILKSVMDTCRHRTCYTCFYRKEPQIISRIRDIAFDAYDEIVTDEKEVWALLRENFPDENIRLYEDSLLSLSALYSIDTHLKEALGKKVWLSCGGYLVIEPTEAMVVIDVNSGKTESKGKNSRDYYLKVNLEAAKEVARQLRIRNYSGMIMVDFINMASDEDNRMLLDYLEGCLRKDKIPTRLVDMTKLGVVEITRKKVNKPLKDFLNHANMIHL